MIVVAFFAILIFGTLISGLCYMGTFKKAGQPLWAAFVPIVNIFFLLKIIGRPSWWILLFLIPFVSIVIFIIVANDLSKSFGHGVGFTLGLIFLSLIFILILSYGPSQYQGPVAAPNPAM